MDIREFKELAMGSSASFTALVKHLATGKSATGGAFTRMTLSDGTGTIQAVMWNVAPCRASDVIQVTGQRKEYNGDPQVQITEVQVRPLANGTILPLLPEATYSMEADLEALSGLVTSLRQEDQEIIRRLLIESPVYEFFIRGPAADSAHHTTQGGLLHHSVSTAGAALHLAGMVDLPASVDTSLLVLGALLHDVGKLWEYKVLVDSNAPLCDELLGHIFIGASYVRSNCPPSPRVEQLVHMILGHHGKWEWGSPVPHRTPEAVLLHLADLMDARADMLRALLLNTPAGAWSAFNNFFGTSIYNGGSVCQM